MASIARRVLKVDMTSDTICPFCIIGYRQLLSAVSSYNASHPATPLDAQVTMHPYQLMPDLAETPVKKHDVMLRRFGAERVEKMGAVMRAKLGEVGVNVDYQNRDPQLSSTHTAHRLLTYAAHHPPTPPTPQAQTQAQAKLGEDLMLAHHASGLDPSDIPTLAALAVKHNVFPFEAAAEDFLRGTELSDEVHRGYARARSQGITGVPFFVFDEKYGVSGAVGEEAFLEIFDQIIDTPASKTTSTRSAAVC